MAVQTVDIKKLLAAGAHFGHKTSRWHPKMAPYIHSKRGGNHIIDLTKTVEKLQQALDFAEKTASVNKQILLVGTKRQAKDIIKQTATETDMPFVSERWIGGMLTNATTMNNRIKHLKDLEQKMDSGALDAKYNKLEVQRYQEEIESMNFLYGGIKFMDNKPGAVFVVDVNDEMNAVKEARKLGIKIIGIVDSNADPSLLDYPIPANDDALKSVQLIVDYLKASILDGKKKSTKITEKAEKVEEETSTDKEKEKTEQPKSNISNQTGMMG